MTIDSMTVNLMVADVPAAAGFYTDVLGGALAFAVDADQQTTFEPAHAPDDTVSASVRLGSSELMLQERSSLVADAPAAFGSDDPLGGTFSIYVRVDDLDAVLTRLPTTTEIVKPDETTWYGMREVWLRDPDGYVVTVGSPNGEPPA